MATTSAPPSLSDSERRVLDIIWRHGPIARVGIGQLTDLSQMSVTRITRELTERGLLSEAINRSGGRGQPSRPLTIRSDAAYAAGAYFSMQSMHVGIVSLSGSLVAKRRIEQLGEDARSIARATGAAVDEMLSEARIEPDKLVGIGFALPGDFIQDRRRIHAHESFPALRVEDLAFELQSALDQPVFVENDAACAALGERLLGIGQTIDHFFFAHVGHGIGGGLILNGELYRGARGNAGIIGVQFPNDAPRPSGSDLLQVLQAGGFDIRDFDDLEKLRPQDCPPLRAWINRASDQLRHGLWITARVLDPDAIIIGGRLPHHILQELVARIGSEDFCNEGVMLPRPRVFASSLGPIAGAIGAAAVPLYQSYLSPDPTLRQAAF